LLRSYVLESKLPVYVSAVDTFVALVFAGDANSEEILVQHLFRSIDEGGYNKWIRPVERAEQQVTVDFQLILRQLVDIDEKEQLMQTNVWLRQVRLKTNAMRKQLRFK